MCQLLSKFGSISSLAYITTRILKADPASKDWKPVTLNHHMNYVNRKDRLFLNQHIMHSFPPSCSPAKTKSAFEVPTTSNLQGKKSVLCRESSLGKSCHSNYRHCLPKPSAVAFITPGEGQEAELEEKRRRTSLSNQGQAAQKSRNTGLTQTGTYVLVTQTSFSLQILPVFT